MDPESITPVLLIAEPVLSPLAGFSDYSVPWPFAIFFPTASGSGLPQLGVMISQTRVSDAGSDVNYKSDSLEEPESLFWVYYLHFLGMESGIPEAVYVLALLRYVAGTCCCH